MEPVLWLRFSVAALAVWRVTHLLALEDGPWDVVVRLRQRLGDGFWGRLLDCFYCLSVWMSAPATLFVTTALPDAVVTWIALSGAACLLERIGQAPVVMSRIGSMENGEDHELLWTETSQREHAPDRVSHDN